MSTVHKVVQPFKKEAECLLQSENQGTEGSGMCGPGKGVKTTASSPTRCDPTPRSLSLVSASNK